MHNPAPHLDSAVADDLKTVAIAANPYSGSRHNRAMVEQLADALRARGLDPMPLWEIDALQHAVEQPDFADGVRCLVSAGGDGTLLHTLNTLHHGAPHSADVPLIMMPLGTENLFAKQYGIGDDPDALADAIAAGRIRTIDLARCGERYWSIVASAGFDGAVIHRLHAWRHNAKKTKRVSRLTYARPIITEALKYGYPMVELDADGEQHRGPLGRGLAPNAVDNDGLLDWMICDRPGTFSLLRYAIATLRGKLRGRKDVRGGRAKRITIACETPVPMQIDGEDAGFAPTVLEVVPAAQRIIVP